MFPTSKIGISQCSNCKQALYVNEMSQPLQMAYNESKQRAKTPLKYFFGLLLIGIFLAFITISVIGVKIAQGSYTKDPKVGDTYGVELDNKLYTFYKIEEINGDTVSFAVHEQTAKSLSAMQKVRNQYQDAYGTARIKFAKKDITDHVGSARVASIDRD